MTLMRWVLAGAAAGIVLAVADETIKANRRVADVRDMMAATAEEMRNWRVTK